MEFETLSLNELASQTKHSILSNVFHDIVRETPAGTLMAMGWTGGDWSGDWGSGDWSGGDWSGGDWSGGDWSGGDWSGDRS